VFNDISGGDISSDWYLVIHQLQINNLSFSPAVRTHLIYRSEEAWHDCGKPEEACEQSFLVKQRSWAVAFLGSVVMDDSWVPIREGLSLKCIFAKGSCLLWLEVKVIYYDISPSLLYYPIILYQGSLVIKGDLQWVTKPFQCFARLDSPACSHAKKNKKNNENIT
jgi:hypothetical protein